jgi:hypothetical protein
MGTMTPLTWAKLCTDIDYAPKPLKAVVKAKTD